MGTILTGPERDQPAGRRSSESAWSGLSWFGVALAVIGFGQMALHLYPLEGFGSPEWEFGTMAAMLGALPLPTVGVAAMVASAQALGRRRTLIALTVLLILVGLGTLGLLTFFWTVAPLALKQSPPAASVVIGRTVGQATLNGLGFTLLYFAAAIMVVRSSKR